MSAEIGDCVLTGDRIEPYDMGRTALGRITAKFTGPDGVRMVVVERGRIITREAARPWYIVYEERAVTKVQV